MRHENTTVGPLSGRFTPNWTIADVLDHYAVHEALPTGLTPELLRPIDEALSGALWRRQARPEALIRSLVMQVSAETARGGIRIHRLLGMPRAGCVPRPPHPAEFAQCPRDRARLSPAR